MEIGARRNICAAAAMVSIAMLANGCAITVSGSNRNNEIPPQHGAPTSQIPAAPTVGIIIQLADGSLTFNEKGQLSDAISNAIDHELDLQSSLLYDTVFRQLIISISYGSEVGKPEPTPTEIASVIEIARRTIMDSGLAAAIIGTSLSYYAVPDAELHNSEPTHLIISVVAEDGVFTKNERCCLDNEKLGIAAEYAMCFDPEKGYEKSIATSDDLVLEVTCAPEDENLFGPKSRYAAVPFTAWPGQEIRFQLGMIAKDMTGWLENRQSGNER